MKAPIRICGLMALLLLGACGSPARNQAAYQPEPNTGTAPDWIVNCIERARDEFHVGYEAVQLQLKTMLPNGGRVGEGTADRGAQGRVTFQCVTNPDDSVRNFSQLPLDGPMPAGAPPLPGRQGAGNEARPGNSH